MTLPGLGPPQLPLLVAVALTVVGCYGDKEAMDPREILAEDLAKVDPEESEQPPAPTAPTRRANTADSQRSDVPATRADCERAARHMIALGQKLERDKESDAKKRQELAARQRADLKSEAIQQEIQAMTKECLDQGNTRRETRCIEQIKRKEDIERCVE